MIDVLGDLKPSLTVYDCMDELSNFKNAPPSLVAKETALFSIADIVFTGGRSLYESKKNKHHNVHLFPSSIDRDHFINGRKQQPDPDDQKTIPRPRIGFFGVIDERMDISLLDAIAAGKPRWSFIILGPVVKIDPGTLPRQPNIFYLGSKSYKELPAYLAGWDVAMMPFALNDATKFISPTKTPEFLAAGKPVVSTAITDVVTMYGEEGLVHIAGTPGEFIEGIEKGLELKENLQWLKAVDRCIGKSSWDETASKMLFIINTCLENKGSDTVKKKKLYV
jgi:UDP-galactopyranose mutase